MSLISKRPRLRSIETACVPEGERQVEQRLAGEKCILPSMINMGVVPASSPNHPFMRLARGAVSWLHQGGAVWATPMPANRYGIYGFRNSRDRSSVIGKGTSLSQPHTLMLL